MTYFCLPKDESEKNIEKLNGLAKITQNSGRRIQVSGGPALIKVSSY